MSAYRSATVWTPLLSSPSVPVRAPRRSEPGAHGRIADGGSRNRASKRVRAGQRGYSAERTGCKTVGQPRLVQPNTATTCEDGQLAGFSARRAVSVCPWCVTCRAVDVALRGPRTHSGREFRQERCAWDAACPDLARSALSGGCGDDQGGVRMSRLAVGEIFGVSWPRPLPWRATARASHPIADPEVEHGLARTATGRLTQHHRPHEPTRQDRRWGPR